MNNPTLGDIGVLPDAVAIVNIPSSDNSTDHGDQIVCVEIKTRVSENTIEGAEAARVWAKPHSIDGDGKVVVCEYNDRVFKECVPSRNRKQVMHQAVVAGRSWGVFITAKVIVQIVFVHMSEESKDDYRKPLLLVAQLLNCWIFNREAIARAYLKDDDFPPWVTTSAKEIISSHFKLWSSFYRRVEEKGPLICQLDPSNMRSILIIIILSGDSTRLQRPI